MKKSFDTRKQGFHTTACTKLFIQTIHGAIPEENLILRTYMYMY